MEARVAARLGLGRVKDYDKMKVDAVASGSEQSLAASHLGHGSVNAARKAEGARWGAQDRSTGGWGLGVGGWGLGVGGWGLGVGVGGWYQLNYAWHLTLLVAV